MKLPKRPGSGKRADHRVAWWSALLLAALGLVLMALFYSGRYVLSLDHGQSPEDQRVLECGLRATPFADDLLPFRAKPNRAEPRTRGS